MGFREDYNTVNDINWIRQVRQRGSGSHMLDQDPTRVKRRFTNDGGLKRNGSAVLLDQQKRLIVRWWEIGWDTKDDTDRYGYLHVIMEMADGRYSTWDIEKLRSGERDGTRSVYAPVGPPGPNDWVFGDGTPYDSAWQVILDGKINSPVRRRNKERPRYQPPVGSLGAFWVGTYGVKGRLGDISPNRRTDAHPFRYPRLGGGTEPPVDPPLDPVLSEEDYRAFLQRTRLVMDG